MSFLLSIATAFALGATSSVHCAAMCGPIVAVGASDHGKLSRQKLSGYLGGRALGYAALGALAGAIGAPLATGRIGLFVRLALSILVALLLLYRAVVLVKPQAQERLFALRRGPAQPSVLEKLIRFLPRRGFGLGLATAIFPCGALFAAVLAAASAGSWQTGAAMMVTFSIASAPLLVLPAIAAARMGKELRSVAARKAAALALVLAAAWVLMPAVKAVVTPERAPCCEGMEGA